MRTLSCLLLTLIVFFCIPVNGYTQELTTEQKEKITSEIAIAFEKSIKAAENLDANMLADNVDDSQQAGFIVSGQYFHICESKIGLSQITPDWFCDNV